MAMIALRKSLSCIQICDQSNMALGFGMLGVAGALGRIIGPIAGAYLSNPAQRLPSVFAGTVFEQFPYFFPCLLAAVVRFNTHFPLYRAYLLSFQVSMVGFLIATKHLTETVPVCEFCGRKLLIRSSCTCRLHPNHFWTR